MPDFIKNFFIGRIAVNIAAGKYGNFAANAYAGLKGRKLYLGLALFFIGSAVGDFPSPLAASISPILATFGAILAALGIVDKPTLKSAPEITKDMRDAIAAACSTAAWLGTGLNGAVTLLQSVGSPRALAVSGQLQFLILVLSTASGYVANLVNQPHLT